MCFEVHLFSVAGFEADRLQNFFVCMEGYLTCVLFHDSVLSAASSRYAEGLVDVPCEHVVWNRFEERMERPVTEELRASPVLPHQHYGSGQAGRHARSLQGEENSRLFVMRLMMNRTADEYDNETLTLPPEMGNLESFHSLGTSSR
jgi:hypothetical protein